MKNVSKALTVTGAMLGLGAAALLLPNSHGRAFVQPLAHSDPPRSPLPATGGKAIVKAGLFDWLFGGSSRERRPEPSPRLERTPPPHGDDRGEDDESDRPRERYQGTFKTLCVRLCDGFYFPLSTATSRERFASDAKRCEQSCPTRSRLFVHRNPGEGVESMIDLEGHPYRDLPTAFQHLNRYDANCTCHGNPWDEAALARHRGYAQEAERKAADQIAQHPAAAQPQGSVARQSSWGYRDRRPKRESGNND
jgi:hypothetical protein